MPNYQITLLTKNEADKDAVKDLITKVGGDVLDERPLGEKPLAYPIKKERTAKITLLKFAMEPANVLELNKELAMSGHSLRHMITTASTKVAKPSTRKTREKELTLSPAEELAAEIKPAEVKETAPQVKVEKPAKEESAKTTAARQKAVEEEIAKLLMEE